MLALRLTRAARPAVQLRRLLVAAASAGTGFLLLGSLGYAMDHPHTPGAAALRLAWCVVPLAATVYLARAVARTDPGTRPRPGLSAVGLGPGRLMAVSALTTLLSCTLGSLVALMLFLHLRGDLTGMPFDGKGAQFLAADRPFPVPAALTLLALLPVAASAAVALSLRPRDPRPPAGKGRAGASFGARRLTVTRQAPTPEEAPAEVGAEEAGWSDVLTVAPPPREAPAGFPWGVAALAAGLAVQAYANRTAPASVLALPVEGAAVLGAWLLTALGLVLAAPGLTYLCGRVLQSAQPGALRLLAGRVLMSEATRIGRPLGVVCAVTSAALATTAMYDQPAAAFGPLSTVATLVVGGCTLATLLTAAVEARQSRAGTTAALLRLGAPATMLRGSAALRAAALITLFVPLTLLIAYLSALPPTG
ncbi:MULTISPECIES: hypothetical protein [unclassified Streptomyces]|uniref:hypothetical protein n=1 Tax=unclassified Streptomyces TaxID=2593676 RepID=UPI002E2D302B|nr:MULTISPECIES: hypothetical protein [unclassified Streptomyces]WUB86522.1 hypothetical protein OG812_07940 [Streptomyces sp. NBC_00566]